MAKIVLIVDDNALIRQALCELFKREADFEVCGEAENGQEAIEKAQQLRPDLIVMDLSMLVLSKEPLHCSFSYSALASFRMGMSASASFQRVRKCL
jgi:DNA-binding NarL/FixJ family response regulator